MKKRILTTEEKNKIIELYLSGKTLTDIYYELKISPIFSKKVLQENDYPLPSKFKYKLNHDVFSKIDSEEKAYWLGFLFADGHIRKRKNKNNFEIKLKLSVKDKEHLEKFKKFLESTHPIVNRTDTAKYKQGFSVSENVSISVYSKKLFDDLSKLGCEPNKTTRISEPKIKSIYYSHFIRGYFDGDGCITFKKNGSFRMVSFTSSSKKILEWIARVFVNENISEKNIYDFKNYHILRFFKKEELNKISDFIYKDSKIFLERKKEKFILLSSLG